MLVNVPLYSFNSLNGAGQKTNKKHKILPELPVMTHDLNLDEKPLNEN
jgi:hypothetical protein